MQRTFTRAVSLLTAVLLISAFSGTGAQAATKATAGGLCAKAATKTMISGKSFTCTKVLSGKLIWVATSGVGSKPQVTGAAGGDDGVGEENHTHKSSKSTLAPKPGKSVASTEHAEGSDE
jgi:hypothetical protein